jgi:hypothetical protein
MSFRRLIPSITFLALFAMALRISTDSDTWWHLRAGSWIVENRAILREDLFSLTRMGQAWIYPGWLAQVVLYAAFTAFGFAGLNLLTALAVVLAFAFIWRVLEGPGLLRAFVVVLAAMTSAVYWSARPQIFSFALAGLFVWILERARHGSWRLLCGLPAAMAVWANVHGGFALGFLLLGAYLAGEALEAGLSVLRQEATVREAWRRARGPLARLTAALMGSAAALCLNPHGPAMWLYPFKTVSIGVLQDYIQEWQSPDFHQLEPQAFLWMLFLVVMAMVASRRRVHATELIGVLAFAYLGFLAGRNIAVFALVAAPVLARHAHSALHPLLERASRGPQVPRRLAKWLNLTLLALVVLAVSAKAAAPLQAAANRRALAERLPMSAVAFIRDQAPTGPLFNSYNWGGYILWELYPDYPSFVDGRTDLFDDEILEAYLETWRGLDGYERVLEVWGIRLVLLEPEAPLARILEIVGWERLYADDQAVVLAAPE